MCKLLNISRSSYYEFLTHRITDRANKSQKNKEEIIVCYNESRKIYGSPRITKSLRAKGIIVSEDTVAKIIKNNNIKSITSKKFKITTNTNHLEPISPNLLNREFKVYAPSISWVSDIKYIRTQEGWLYLTSIIDLFDRKVNRLFNK